MYWTYNCTASVCFCRILPSLFLPLPPQTFVYHLRTPTDWNQSPVCFAPLDLCAEHFRLSCWKIFLSCSTQTEEATSVSLASCDRLRKPWGRSSTTVRLTGWPMSRSFLANITESSSRASRAEACGGGRKGRNNQSPDQPANGSNGSKKMTLPQSECLFRLTNVVLNLWGWTFVSYHYVYWWKASQQVVGGQQRRHKGVPNNGTGSEGNESLALGAQRLEALRVADVRPVVSCGHVRGCSERYIALGSPHCWCGWSRPWRAPGLQERRDPVGGTLGEIAEQHSRVSSEGAARVTPHGRMHRPPVYPWQIWWNMNNSSITGCFQVGPSSALQKSDQDHLSVFRCSKNTSTWALRPFSKHMLFLCSLSRQCCWVPLLSNLQIAFAQVWNITYLHKHWRTLWELLKARRGRWVWGGATARHRWSVALQDTPSWRHQGLGRRWTRPSWTRWCRDFLQHCHLPDTPDPQWNLQRTHSVQIPQRKKD